MFTDVAAIRWFHWHHNAITERSLTWLPLDGHKIQINEHGWDPTLKFRDIISKNWSVTFSIITLFYSFYFYFRNHPYGISVHFGLFSLIRSILCNPFQSNSGHFGLIQSGLLHLVHFIYFGPIRSISVYFVHFGPFYPLQQFRSTLTMLWEERFV